MPGDTSDLSSLLGGLLSSPGALSALSGLLGGMKPTRDESHGEAPPPPPPPAQHTERRGEREALLAALRPYLSEHRCQALTGACKLLEVIELLKEAGGHSNV